MLGDAIEVDPLQGESGELTSVRQCHGGPQCRVVADVVDRRDGSRELQIGEIHSGLDEVEHQSRRTDLEVRRHLRQIRVADDHVQSAVLVGVRVRFVAGVDDAPLERRLEAHLHLDVVGALRQLEPGFVPGLADTDASRAADHLPGREERRQPRDHRGEGRLPGHQVVLVRPVRRALAVDVVLVELQSGRPGNARRVPGRSLHHPLTRLVPDDGIERVGDLGGRVLGMRVIDVETRTVGEDHVGRTHLVRVDHRRGAVEPSEVESTCVP